MECFTQPTMMPLVVAESSRFTVCGQAHLMHGWLREPVIVRSDGFVIPDPDGYMLIRYGKYFRRNGYRVKNFDTSNLRISARYNPFSYARSDAGISKLVTAFIAGTTGAGKPGDMRFAATEALLLAALFAYVCNETFDEERNIGSVIELLKHMLPDEGSWRYFNDTDYLHAVDFLFEDLTELSPNCLAAKNYRDFKHVAGTNAGAVTMSCAGRLKPFSSKAMKNYFSKDSLCLDDFRGYGGRKTALFVSAGQSGTYDFLAQLIYTQLFDILFEKGSGC